MIQELILTLCLCTRLVYTQWSIINSTTQVVNKITRLSTYSPELKLWALINTDGEIQIFRRSTELLPKFTFLSSVNESASPAQKTITSFYSSGQTSYLMTATEGTRSILFFNYSANSTTATHTLATGHTDDIFSLFQLPATSFGISACRGVGQLKKWNFDTRTEIGHSLTTIEYHNNWAYIEDNLITGSDLVGNVYIVDSSAMTVSATLSGLPASPNVYLRYKKTYPSAANELIMALLDGTIQMRDISSSSAEVLKQFPAPTPSSITPAYIDIKYSLVGVKDTKFILICAVYPHCYFANPLDSPSGAALPRNFELSWHPDGPVVGMAFQGEDETLFYALTASNATKFIGISLCGGDGCGRCSADYSNCQSCRFGDEIIDPVTSQRSCLFESPNRAIERISKTALRCVNCLTEASVDTTVCNFTKSFVLKKAGADKEDIYSSLSVEISFDLSSEFLALIPNDYPWLTYFNVILGKNEKNSKRYFFEKVKFFIFFKFFFNCFEIFYFWLF